MEFISFLGHIFFGKLYTNFTPISWDKIGILEICGKTNTYSIAGGFIPLIDLNWYKESYKKKQLVEENNNSCTDFLEKASK